MCKIPTWTTQQQRTSINGHIPQKRIVESTNLFHPLPTPNTKSEESPEPQEPPSQKMDYGTNNSSSGETGGSIDCCELCCTCIALGNCPGGSF